MKTREVARAVELWAVEVSTNDADLADLSSFDYPPEDLSKAMPLVVAEVQDKRRQQNNQGQKFQQRDYQQTAIVAWEVDLMILVPPDPAWTASYSLYDYVDALAAALKKDSTLGGRVTFASKDYVASFDPPEVEHDDGTVARAATVTVNIGEQEEV